MRELVRALKNTVNDRLRHGKVDEAEEILESCTRMGINFASAEPESYMHWLVGSAVFKLAAADLEPIYREFGQMEKLASLKKTGNAFEQGSEKIRALASLSYDEYIRTMAKSNASVLSLLGAAYTTCWILPLVGLLWVISITAQGISGNNATLEYRLAFQDTPYGFHPVSDCMGCNCTEIPAVFIRWDEFYDIQSAVSRCVCHLILVASNCDIGAYIKDAPSQL